MKPRLSPLPFLSPSRLLATTFIGYLFAITTASAQQGTATPQSPNYAPPANYNAARPGYGEPRPKVTERVGSFVRSLFYGELGSRSKPKGQPSYSGHSLDRPPQPSYRPAPDSPPSSTQPQRTSPSPKPPTQKKTPPPAAKKPSGQYQPPKVQNTPPAPRPTPKQPVKNNPPTPAPAEVKPNAPVEVPPQPQESATPEPNPVVADTLPSQEQPPSTASSADQPPPNAPAPAQEDPKPTLPASNNNQFLIGKKTAVPGRVISPYPPHQELDVSGLSSGSLALDPTTNKVFQIP
jgi:hypothetical protein